MNRRFWLLVLLAVAGTGTALAASYEGVNLPDTVTVGGKPLVLNGMGIRKFLWVSVYVGALYLPEKATTPEAVMAEQGPYRVVMALKHDISHEQFADHWRDDLKANNPDVFGKIKPQVEQFVTLFDDAREGDEIVMDYVPGQGLSVTHNGKLMGNVAGDAFARALLHVYVGPHPPSDALKAGLLGKED